MQIKDVSFEQHKMEIEALKEEAKKASEYAQQQLDKIAKKKDKMPFPLAISAVLIAICIVMLFIVRGRGLPILADHELHHLFHLLHHHVHPGQQR